MGFFDSLFGGSTYAESQRDKFQQLVSTLSGKISELDAQIDRAEEEIKIIHNALDRNPDSAEGTIMTEFNKKHLDWHMDAFHMTNKMRQAEADLNGKLEEAQQKYEYWCEEVRREQEEEARRRMEAQLAAQQALENQ